MDDSLLRERLGAQLLAGPPAASAVDVVERVGAVAAQDGRGFRLALRCRSAGVTAADVDAALVSGELVIGWLNRGTLHLVRRDDYWWMHALTAPRQLTGNRRRLSQEGLDDVLVERGVRVVAEALESGGPRTRADLRARLDEAGVPTAGQALVHLLAAAGIDGLLVRGPVVDHEPAFVDPRRWIGPRPDFPARDELLARLARRYLTGHGPAEAVDLTAWSGLPLRDAHRGLELIDDETEDRPAGCVALRGRPSRPALPPPRLLGPFDPILHGWKSRELVVGPYRPVVILNGIFRPVAFVAGRVAATWRLADGMVTIEPRRPLPAEVLDALSLEGTAVLRYLGLPARPVLVSEPGD